MPPCTRAVLHTAWRQLSADAMHVLYIKFRLCLLGLVCAARQVRAAWRGGKTSLSRLLLY
jgi:hypothetical protein